MIIIKTPDQIEGIRKSSQLAAKTLAYLKPFVQPGVSTQKLNDLAHQFILKNNATPAPLGYGGFPKSICTSVNNVVCHGIPSKTQILQKGDIVNLDITTILNSFYGDVSESLPVGRVSPAAQLLIKRTKIAMNKAIKNLKPGRKLNICVGRTIEDYVTQFGYAPIRRLGGHGVGIKFHEEPFVYHHFTTENDIVLRPGMIFTIEPMINASKNSDVIIDPGDGWTVRTTDGALSAQFEHTLLITPTGYEILTKI